MDNLPARVGLPYLLGVSLEASASLVGILINVNNFHVIILVGYFEKAIIALGPFIPEFPDFIYNYFPGNFPIVGVLVIAIGGKVIGKRSGGSLFACP